MDDLTDKTEQPKGNIKSQTPSSDPRQNEGQAATALKNIYEQETKYKRDNGKYLDATELFRYELVDGEVANAAGVRAMSSQSGKYKCTGDHLITRYGYQFRIVVNNSTSTFSAKAIPVSSYAGDKELTIGDDGIILTRSIKQNDPASTTAAQNNPSNSHYPPPPSIVRRSEVTLRSMAINSPEPYMPDLARAGRVEGDVVVEVNIGEDGSVISARAVSGHQLLKDAAVAAAKQWKFSPTYLNNQAVKVSGVLTFRFKQ